MRLQGSTRRTLLRAGGAVVGAVSVAGCSAFSQPRSPVTIGRTSARQVVPDAPKSDGPLLYGTVINSASEAERRIDWRAFNELVIVDDPEKPPEWFRDIPYGDACLTVLTTQFDVSHFYEKRDDFESVPVTFGRDSCTFELEFGSPPPLNPTSGETDEPRYYTQMRAWEMEGRTIPTDGTVTFVVDTSKADETTRTSSGEGS